MFEKHPTQAEVRANVKSLIEEARKNNPIVANALRHGTGMEYEFALELAVVSLVEQNNLLKVLNQKLLAGSNYSLEVKETQC